VVGYVIAVIAFLIPFGVIVTRIGRPVSTLAVGALLAVGWLVALTLGEGNKVGGKDIAPLWFLVGLVLFLYAIWCGGVLLAVRLRRLRPR
jgi:type VI protein secretion system component VasK